MLRLASVDNALLSVARRTNALQPFWQQPRLKPMTWDHRIAKVAPLAAMAIAAFATLVTFAAYYH
jgi:hypothetical protein